MTQRAAGSHNGRMPARTTFALALAVLTLAGCAQPEEFSSELSAPAEGSSRRGDVTLPDGRRVVVYSPDGRRYVEQHYDPVRRAWTAPDELFDAGERCTGPVELATRGGTVAGRVYCGDLASVPGASFAMATGDLRTWDVADLGQIEGVNQLSANGAHAVYWRHDGGGAYDVFRWDEGEGFDELTMYPPAPSPEAALVVVPSGQTFPEEPMPFGSAWFADNDGGVTSVDVRAWDTGRSADPVPGECWIEVFRADPGDDGFTREFAGSADVPDYCGTNEVERTTDGGFRVHVVQVPASRSRDYELVPSGDGWEMHPSAG